MKTRAARWRLSLDGRFAGAILSSLLAAIWGFTYLIIKWGLRDTGPMTLGAARVLLGGGALILIARLLAGPAPASPKEHLKIAIVGQLQVGIFIALLNLGAAQVSAGIAALIVYTQPLLVAALGAALFRERLGHTQTMGLLVGAFGLALVLSPNLRVGHGVPWLSYAFLFGAAVSWAMGVLLFKRFNPDIPFLWAVGMQTLYGAIPLLIAAIGIERLKIHASLQLLAVVLFLGLIATGLAYVLWFRLLTRSSAVVASISLLMVPMYASVFGALVLGEKWTSLSCAGALCILASIGLVSRQGGAPSVPRTD